MSAKDSKTTLMDPLSDRDGPLSGLRVLDFGWAIAAPQATKYLGDFGATVIKLESSRRTDPTRNMTPMSKGINGVNRSLLWLSHNTSKYSICVDLTKPKGLEVARRLVSKVDVITENFTVQTMEQMGLGYDECRKINPGIIMVRASLQGQHGPNAQMGGFGIMMQALAGSVYPIGYDGQPPICVPVAVTDFMALFQVVNIIMAALDYRDRTGKGCHIDLSQFESGVTFLATPVLDFVANGQRQERSGNSSPYSAPHGVYRCAGHDRWCAITVSSEEEWRAFCTAIGSPGWTEEERFSILSARKENEAELNRLVTEWTTNQPPEDVVDRMQLAGVPAGVVKNGRDLHADPQLAYRRHFKYIEHPEIGRSSFMGLSFRLSRTPEELAAPPLLGEHTELVCREILGMTDQEFVELLNEGVFS